MEENFIKITSALYKILDCLPDNDPLKNRAKEKTLSIVENMTLVSEAQGWVSLQKEKAGAQLLDDINVLENLLEIGKSVGWIDTMNFLIITKEYRAIKNSIQVPEGLVRQSIEISYRVPKDIIIEKSQNQLPPVEKEEIVKPVIIEGDQTVAPLGIKIYSPRQQKILEMLREGKKAQVADIIKQLPDVTKRTIRRDLDELLKDSKIVRVGEWNQVFYKINSVSDRTYNLS